MEPNQTDLLAKFQSFLKKIYGTDIMIENKQAKTMDSFNPPLELEEREIQLIEWMYQVLKGMNLDSTLKSITDWKQLLQVAWKQAAMQAAHPPTVNERVQFRNYAGSLPLPAYLIYIQLTNEFNHSDLVDKGEVLTEWMNLIFEMANTEKERCFIVPISKREAGILLCVEEKLDHTPYVEGVTEECKAWVDALLGELYLDAAVSISSLVDNVEHVVDGMEQALEASKIGRLFYGSHGVFAFEQLALQRMMHDIVKRGFVDCESLLPRKQYELLGNELRDTALSFFRNHLNSSETARVLYLHRNSLLYRLDKIREITGYDIRKFEEAAALWTALNFWRIATS